MITLLTYNDYNLRDWFLKTFYFKTKIFILLCSILMLILRPIGLEVVYLMKQKKANFQLRKSNSTCFPSALTFMGNNFISLRKLNKLRILISSKSLCTQVLTIGILILFVR